MRIQEKLAYLQDNHFEIWLTTRKEVEDELSKKQEMFCVCHRLATGLHENYCKTFQNKVNSETVKRLKHLIVKKQAGFTLIELIIVVAIIALLATLVIAAYNNAKNQPPKLEYFAQIEEPCEEDYVNCKYSCSKDVYQNLTECVQRCDIQKEHCEFISK